MKNMNYIHNRPSYILFENNRVGNPFNLITKEIIESMVDAPGGYEGHNTKEDAFVDIMYKLNQYQSLPEPLMLYRVISVGDVNDINQDAIGDHYVLNLDDIDESLFSSIGASEWSEECETYVITVSVNLSEIDIMSTLVTNLAFPNEQEITLRDNGRGANIVSIDKLN